MLEPAGFDQEHVTPAHNDDGLWLLQLADAFGTRSVPVINTFLGQLERLLGRAHWDNEAHQWRVDENEFSAALAIINSIKPRNELEAAQAAQAVAIHMLTMKLTARAIRYDYDTRTAATAGKLARTFVMQVEAIQRSRGRTKTVKQSIKVSRETHHHQHIHVHREGSQNDGQCHGPNEAPADNRSALPGPDQGGRVVPLPSRSRQG